MPEQIKLPAELSSIQEGSVWCREPLKPDVICLLEVTKTFHRAGEWWVESKAMQNRGHCVRGKLYSNEVSRFIEAAVLVSSS